MLDNLMEKLNKIGSLCVSLAYINLLWIVFSLLGLVIVGLFPATVSMLHVIRKLLENDEVEIFELYKKIYKQEFLKANIIGWLLTLFGSIILVDLLFILNNEGMIFTVLLFVLFLLLFTYLSITFYIFPIISYYQLSLMNYIKYAFVFSISFPHYTVLIFLSFLFIIAVFITFPLLIPLFSASGFGIALVVISNKVIKKVSKIRSSNQVVN